MVTSKEILWPSVNMDSLITLPGPSRVINSLLTFLLTYVLSKKQLAREAAKPQATATLIVSRRDCVSATLMINISETKPFRGSCPIGKCLRRVY